MFRIAANSSNGVENIGSLDLKLSATCFLVGESLILSIFGYQPKRAPYSTLEFAAYRLSAPNRRRYSPILKYPTLAMPVIRSR